VKTYIEIFNEQQTKLKEIQFVDSGTRLDSTSGHTIAVTSVAIAIAIMVTAIDITFIAVIVILLLINPLLYRRRKSSVPVGSTNLRRAKGMSSSRNSPISISQQEHTPSFQAMLKPSTFNSMLCKTQLVSQILSPTSVL
jgi:hypothetical protein